MFGSEVARLFVTIGANTAEFTKGLATSSQQMQAFGRQMTSIGKGMTVGLTLPIVAFATKAVMAFNEAEAAAAKMEAVLDSTGATAWTTSEGMQSLAASIQETTTFEDDLVVGAEAVLLTFKSIRNEMGEGNDVFDRTMRVAADLSTVLGSDLNGAALQLGKALEDPIRGVAALRRSGVSFTQEQLDMIKTLVNTNQKLEAQKLILAEVESQFGGAAAAVADTAGGKITQALNKMGDAMERVGAIIAPWIANIVSALSTAFEWFTKLPTPIMTALAVFAGLVAITGPVLLGIGLMATAFGELAIAMGLSSGALLTLLGQWGLFIVVASAAWAAAYKLGQVFANRGLPTEELGTELSGALLEVRDSADSAAEAAKNMVGWLREANNEDETGISDYTYALEQMELAFQSGRITGEEAARVLDQMIPDALQKAGYSGQKFVDSWTTDMERAGLALGDLQTEVFSFAGMTGETLFDWKDQVVGSFDIVGDAMGTLADDTKVTVKDMNDALTKQLDAWRNWSANMKALIKRGLDPTIVQDFIEQGPEKAATAVQALVEANDKDLNTYQRKWMRAHEGPDTFVSQLIALAARVSAVMSKMVGEVAAAFASIAAMAPGSIDVTIHSRLLKNTREGIVPQGASGALVSRPTLALIGEAGPEAVVPLNQMPGASPLPGGGGSNLTVNVVLDRKTFARQQDYYSRASGL